MDAHRDDEQAKISGDAANYHHLEYQYHSVQRQLADVQRSLSAKEHEISAASARVRIGGHQSL